MLHLTVINVLVILKISIKWALDDCTGYQNVKYWGLIQDLNPGPLTAKSRIVPEDLL